MNPSSEPTVPLWLRGWAVFTVVVALLPIALGAEVTTKAVGMADPYPVREPYYLFTLSWEELWSRGRGLVIEHSHRTAGWLIGACSIVLAAGTWFGARGTGVRAAGLVALALVIAQGLLGIFRVGLNARIGPEAALIHGLFAQVVFATLVGVAVMYSVTWRKKPVPEGAPRSTAALLVMVTFAQLVFGSLVRHQHGSLAQRLHLLCAFAVVAVVVWFLRETSAESVDRPVRRLAWILTGLVILQVSLGIEAWLSRFGSGVPVEQVQATAASDFVRSAHYFVGALLFASTVAVNLLLYRPLATAGNEPIPATQSALLATGPASAGIGGAL